MLEKIDILLQEKLLTKPVDIVPLEKLMQIHIKQLRKKNVQS